MQWATDEQAADNKPGGSIGLRRRRRGAGLAQPAGTDVRDPADATQIRLVANDEDLAPAALDRGHPAADPAAAHAAGRRRARTDPVLLDWLVGLAFPCQRPFGHQNGVDEAPKWRILPDRFGAEANSPVMDNNGGGPLGITELLVRADHRADLSEGRLVPGLGRAAAADAVLPERRTRPPGPGYGHPQRPVEPGAAQGVLSAITPRVR